MEPLRFTGGIQVDLPSFGRFNASYPFTRLTICDNSVHLAIDFESMFPQIAFFFYIFGTVFKWNREFDIPFAAIDTVEKHCGILSTGVRIRHRAQALAYIVFWSGAWQEILRLLAENGVSVRSST